MLRSSYFLVLLWFVFVALFSQFVEVTEKKEILGKERTVITWWFAILVFLPLIFMATNRSGKVGDTMQYIRTYESMPSGFSAIPKYYSSLTKDKGFYLVGSIIKCIFGSDYKIYFFLIASFQAFCLIRTYRRYSPKYFTAILLFVLSTDFVSWMQNGTRQFVAVSICLLATQWMIEKKYIPAVITIFIASRFHGTALLMIPIFLVCIGKPWNARTLLVLAATLLAIAFVSQFTTWLDAALDETQYTNVVTDWQAWNDDGTNPIRVLIYSIPAVFSFIGLRYIREEDDIIINFCTNMSIVTTGLYLVSMVTSGIFIGRLPIYASLYSNGVLLPWEIEHIFNKKSAQTLRIAMIALYAVFYIYQINRWGYF